MDVPFELRDGRVWVSVRVGGRDARAIFDTGSDGTVLDTGLAGALGLALREGPKGSTVAGNLRLRQGSPVTLDLGDRELRVEEPMVVPIAAQLPTLDAILGFDVLRSLPMTLDYAALKVRVGALPRGEPLPFILEGDLRPTVWVESLGGRFEAHLDTGSAQGISLPRAWVEANAPHLLRDETRRQIMGEVVTSSRLVLDRVRIGSAELTGVPGEAVSAKGGSFADSARPWANVGNQVLGRFRVGLDGKKRVTVLEPVP